MERAARAVANKNVFFGLNDVGKTNFLYALRYVFDKDVRKQNILDSDFHNKQLDKPIEIVVTIDISDTCVPYYTNKQGQQKCTKNETKKESTIWRIR